jgi:tetratricopeptide (TPR) repeat protein
MRTLQKFLLCRSLTGTAVACVLAMPLLLRADGVSELDDATARMQYAFYTADARGVQEGLNLLNRVELPASMYGMKEYFTAYGQWKLAELHTDEVNAGRRTARALALKAASDCARTAEVAQKADPTFAEAFAIEAICSAIGSRTPEMLSRGGCTKHKGLRTALELAPNNPRVQLIDAQCAGSDTKQASAAAVAQLRKVIAAFEAAPPSRPGRPDWGYAEALLLLGKAYLSGGDTVTARDFIERALVIAPDYKSARDALQAPTTRPR